MLTGLDLTTDANSPHVSVALLFFLLSLLLTLSASLLHLSPSLYTASSFVFTLHFLCILLSLCDYYEPFLALSTSDLQHICLSSYPI